MGLKKLKWLLLKQAEENLEEIFDNMGEEELNVLASDGDTIEIQVGPLDVYDSMSGSED